LDFGGYKIITKNCNATRLLQIWAEGVKDVTVVVQPTAQEVVCGGQPTGWCVNGISPSTHTLMDFTPPRTTRHANILKQLIHQTVLKTHMICEWCASLYHNTRKWKYKVWFTFSAINFTSITINVYLQNKITPL